MGGFFLRIDTSNYTTSAALYGGGPELMQKKRLLTVKEGEKGLQQSTAVFQHIRRLPALLEELLAQAEGCAVSAVGASARPRDAEGSYMPCFTVGEGVARSIAASLHVPFFDFSHQAGHIAAAVYSADVHELYRQSFLAFHVSGGTTEALLVSPSRQSVFDVRLLARSLDLKAGQAVDRAGVMMGLAFPCGVQLEQLALRSSAVFSIKPCLKGADCCLSGLENKCREMLEGGRPKEDVARYCLEFIKVTLDAMAERVVLDHPGLPLVFAGGVMADSILRGYFEQKYGAVFALPAFSSDNAAGVAVLTKIKAEGI